MHYKLYSVLTFYSTLSGASFFHTLHAGQRLIILSPIFLKNTLPQFSQDLKSFNVIIILFSTPLFHLGAIYTSMSFSIEFNKIYNYKKNI